MCKKNQLKKIPHIQIQEQDTTEYVRSLYNNQSKNNLSYWYNKINTSLITPDTIIIPLSFERFYWLGNDRYEQDDIAAFSHELIEYMHQHNFNTDRELFVKTGTFSNKFRFNHGPHVTDINNIGTHALECAYGGLCVGCEFSREIVVREFIHTDYVRPSIYDGMKLNTEMRVFYDFDNNVVLGIFNYWDKETMIQHLHNDELSIFTSCIDDIERDVQRLTPILLQECEKLKSVNLQNQWSIDFLWDGHQFYLIDMALAQNSYYFDKVLKARQYAQ